MFENSHVGKEEDGAGAVDEGEAEHGEEKTEGVGGAGYGGDPVPGEGEGQGGHTAHQEEEGDHQDEEDEESKEAAPGFSPVPKSTYDFLLQKKHVRCDVKLVSLFQSELCKAVCNHCADPESFTVHTLQVDMPRQVVYMECQVCGWTTVRRVTIAAVTVS